VCAAQTEGKGTKAIAATLTEGKGTKDIAMQVPL